MIEIFLVDDNPFMRKTMKQLIELDAAFKVCGEAASVEDALKALEDLKPDIALVDISLGGDERGIELIKNIRSLGHRFSILTVSLHEEALYADRVYAAGAQGYLMKQDAPERIIHAIQHILSSGPARGKEAFYRGTSPITTLGS